MMYEVVTESLDNNISRTTYITYTNSIVKSKKNNPIINIYSISGYASFSELEDDDDFYYKVKVHIYKNENEFVKEMYSNSIIDLMRTDDEDILKFLRSLEEKYVFSNWNNKNQPCC